MFVHLLLATMTIKVTHIQTHTFVIGALGGPWWKWKWRKYLFLEQPCIDIYSIINEMMFVHLLLASMTIKATQSDQQERDQPERLWLPSGRDFFFQTEHHSLISALNTFCQFIFNYCLYEFEFLWLSSGHCFSHAPFITSHFGLFDRWTFLMIWCVYNWKATTLRSSFIWLINSADG